jgi:gliding motility-associated-like protein
MRKLILLFLFLSSLVIHSQGETNIWYFGARGGLDFNSGSPVVLTDGKLDTGEGCATISNASGQLLMYTDGVNIWNKNHQIMPNGTGLLGQSSTTQSAIIIPNPANPNIYYVFTTSVASASTGIRYSEVDLTLDGGFGDVTIKKNIELVAGEVSEKLTAIKNKNATGYWLMGHGFLNNSFYAFQVTGAGVNSTPVTTDIGSVFDSYNSKFGYLKFSPDGSKLANPGNSYPSSIEIFDFDSSTGILSNFQFMPTPNRFNYGLEFSASGNLLYTSSIEYVDKFHDTTKICQYDLKAIDISASEVVLYTIGSSKDLYVFLGALQLAPDNHIYLSILDNSSIASGNYISRIENPEVYGLGCNFVLKALDLSPNKCALGLPQFIQSYFTIGINFQNNCLGETTSFSLNSNATLTSANWNFGDGNTSAVINPTHTYSSAGTYTVSLTASSASGTITKSRDIIISTIPTATKPNDILACDNNNDGFYVFDLTTQNTSILNGQDSNRYVVSYFANNELIPSPAAYTNTVAYQHETIRAEVSNKANGECKSITSFNIDVFDTPLPSLPITITNLTSCDNTSFGTDNDGKVIFDLTQKTTNILNGQSATQFLISYFNDAGLTVPILNPAAYQNTNSAETIFVKVANKDILNCTAVTSFKIEVFALPAITNAVDLKQCDDNIDGFSVFNLEEAIDKITGNATSETVTFFKTDLDAHNNTNPIQNATSYTNQIVSIDKVFVRVANSNGCYRVTQLNLIVSTTQIPLTFKRDFMQCDDAISGSNTDGLASFDFSSVTNQIQSIFPVGQQLNITYYRNLADAFAEKNAILDISNYRNIGSPNIQNIYIRVDSRLNNDCLGLGNHITLMVEPIPIVQSLKQNHCDDDQDGLYAFDTSAIEGSLLNGLTNVTISYFDQNNNLLPSPLPNPFVTGSQTIKVFVANNTSTACSFDTTLQFVVDDLPEAFPLAVSLTTVCDDEIDPVLQDGKYAFDTSSFQNVILGGQTGMKVNYFDGNSNPLSSPLPNPFMTATQNVKVEVVNPVNLSCVGTTVIPFVVNPVPKIQLTGDELVCSDLSTFTKIINAGLLDEAQKANFNYSWALDGIPIVSETNYDWMVNKKGIYEVETSNNLGCSRTRVITVNASDKATVKVNIVDLSSENSITIFATGAGDYVFSLDNENEDYQSSNVFTNVPAGIHTVFIKDLNGCGVVQQEIAILGIPNYFTPNQDGYNDTWNIKGVNDIFNAKTAVRIFDRYGKLIKEINPIDDGWDGTYLGQQMPATDYWYSIQLQDGRVFKGHFALKR